MKRLTQCQWQKHLFIQIHLILFFSKLQPLAYHKTILKQKLLPWSLIWASLKQVMYKDYIILGLFIILAQINLQSSMQLIISTSVVGPIEKNNVVWETCDICMLNNKITKQHWYVQSTSSKYVSSCMFITPSYKSVICKCAMLLDIVVTLLNF